MLPSERHLVVGLGNPILGDDSIGFRIAALLARVAATRPGRHPDLEIVPTSLSGFRLLDLIRGFDRLTVIDSMSTGLFRAGHLSKIRIDEMSGLDEPPPSVHHFSLGSLIELAGTLAPGSRYPTRIGIYAIEIRVPRTYTTDISPDLRDRVWGLARTIWTGEGLGDFPETIPSERVSTTDGSPLAAPGFPGGAGQ